MEKMANPLSSAQGNVAHVNPNPTQSAMNFARRGGTAAPAAFPVAQVAAATGDPRNPAIAQAHRRETAVNQPPKGGDALGHVKKHGLRKRQSWGNAARNAAGQMPINRFGSNPAAIGSKLFTAAKTSPKAMVTYLADKNPVGLPAMNEFIGRTHANRTGVPYAKGPTSYWGAAKHLGNTWKHWRRS